MRRTKEEKRYIVINVILALIILVLGIYIYLVLRSNKSKIIASYEQGINILADSMQVETINIENPETTEKTTLIIPIDSNDEINEDNSEYDFEAVKNNKYFYNQLNDNAKMIYDTIEDNLNNMTSGDYEIKLSKEITNIMFQDGGEEQLNQNFQSAWDALALDRVDIFFIDISQINLLIKKTTYGTRVSYELEITSVNNDGYLKQGLENSQTVYAMLNKIKGIRDNIIQKTSGNNYSRALQVHDWIIENLEYSTDSTNDNVYNLYGAFIDKSAVCEGYAEAFKYILDELEIPCILVSGTATNSEGTTENHEWNYVQLNGNWYGVDSTWDDPIIRGFGKVSESTKHKYFLVGKNTINSNHFAKGQITTAGKEFIYPELSESAY